MRKYYTRQCAYNEENVRSEEHHVTHPHVWVLRRFRPVSRLHRIILARQLGQVVSLHRFHASVYDGNFLL